MLQIATPNTDRSLLTLAERKAALGITDSSRDAELTALGGYVDASITRACKVAVASDIPPTLRLEPVTETFRLQNNVDVVFLSRRPIVEIASVTQSDGTALVADTDYEVDGQGVYKLVNGQRPCGRWAYGPPPYWGGGTVPNSLVIAYSAGWDIVPDDLKYAAIKYTQAEWNGGGQPRDPLLKSVSIEGVSSREYWVDPTKDSSIPAEVFDILESGGYINRWGWMR